MALLTNINGKFSVSDAGAVTFNNAFTFPTTDGTANYVLKTNGSGTVSWSPDSSPTVYWAANGNDIYNTNSGNVGIGGTKANKKLYVLGDTTNYQILAEQPSGYAGLSIKSTTLAQTWSWIANDNGSNSDLLLYGGAAAGVKLTIDSSGNATFAPTGGVITLGANGHITSKQSLDVTTAGGRYIGSSNRGILGQIRIEQTTTSADGGYIAFDTCASGSTSPTPRLTIDSSGNVGIGGTPSTFANFTNVTIQGGSSGSNLDFKNSSGTRVSAIVTTASNELIIETGTAQPIIFKTNDTETMRINSGGNVNILNATATDSKHIGITNAAGTTGWTFGNGVIANTHQFVIYDNTAGSARMLIDSSGNVGIGTTSPGVKLEVEGSTNAIIKMNSTSGTGGRMDFAHAGSNYGNIGSARNILGSGNAADMMINADSLLILGVGSQDMTILPSGNVGIGTTSPQGKLDSVAPVADLTDFGRATGSALNIRIGNAVGYLGQINFCNDAAPAFGYGSIGMVMTSGSGIGLGDMVFGTKSSGSAVVSTERMRITSGGDILIGTQTASLTSGNTIYQTGGMALTRAGNNVLFINRQTNFGAAVQFYQNNDFVGSISVTSTATSYNTSSSDERLKKNITNWDENILDKFKDIKPKEFNFNTQEDTEEKIKGYIAQNEVDNFPEAYPLVYNEEAKEDRHLFNPSGMVVYLMKAIQELKAEIEILKNK